MSPLLAALIGAAHAAETPSGGDPGYIKLGPITADATFFTLVGLILFLALVWRMGGFKAIIGVLDARRDRITAELDEAARLRAEAQALLAEYEQKRAAAEVQAREIVAQARADAETLRRTAKAELEAELARRDRVTGERIARAELQATTEARAAAVEAAIATAERLIAQQMSPAIQTRLMAEGLDELAQRFTPQSP